MNTGKTGLGGVYGYEHDPEYEFEVDNDVWGDYADYGFGELENDIETEVGGEELEVSIEGEVSNELENSGELENGNELEVNADTEVTGETEVSGELEAEGGVESNIEAPAPPAPLP